MTTDPHSLDQLLQQADATRSTQDEARSVATLQTAVFVFRLGELRLGIPARAMHSVIAGERPTKLPLAPAHVRGLVAHRDGALAIVDLSAFLGLGTTSEDAMLKGRVLLVHHGEYEVGLLCDQATGVQLVASDELDDTLVVRAGRVADFTRHECNTRDGRLAVLDLDRLLDAARVHVA